MYGNPYMENGSFFLRVSVTRDTSPKEVISSTALCLGWEARKHCGMKSLLGSRWNTDDISKCSVARAEFCSISRPAAISRYSMISTEILSTCTAVCGSNRINSRMNCGICSIPVWILNI